MKIDQGGVLVGKLKLAQFSSGANPWDWQDEVRTPDPPTMGKLLI